ncbi:MAG: hypothetical protein KR126chlam1_00899 [Chlamydiae bacterium]|nr:hypothetical protein [Chlamydiota bacterium]
MNKQKKGRGVSKKKERTPKETPKEEKNKWQEFLHRHSKADEKPKK